MVFYYITAKENAALSAQHFSISRKLFTSGSERLRRLGRDAAVLSKKKLKFLYEKEYSGDLPSYLLLKTYDFSDKLGHEIQQI